MVHNRCKKEYAITVDKKVVDKVPYKNMANNTVKELRKRLKGTGSKVQMKRVKC